MDANKDPSNRLTCGSCATKTESKHSHGHSTLALSAINVRVGSENVRNGLWCVWQVCVSHCELIVWM
jgi:hypothetical protein